MQEAKGHVGLLLQTDDDDDDDEYLLRVSGLEMEITNVTH